MDRGIGEIFTWGVPDILPTKEIDLVTWELDVPNNGVSGFANLNLTADNSGPLPMLQIVPGSNIGIRLELFAQLQLDSTGSTVETRVTDAFGSGRVLQTDSQNLSECSDLSRIKNSIILLTQPQTSQLLTQLSCTFSGSGILCEPRICRFNVKVFFNSGGPNAFRIKNIMGVNRRFFRIN